MKPFIFFYCEGSETKVAVATSGKEGLQIHKTFAVSLTGAKSETKEKVSDDFNLEGMGDDDLSFDSLEGTGADESGDDTSDVTEIADKLSDIKLNQAQFIPIITDPTVSFHVYEGDKLPDRNKQLDLIVQDIQKAKDISISKDMIDFVDLNDKALLCVFIESGISCVDMINSMASLHGRRYYKIETIKNAEIALANFVSKTTKFFPEDYTLIIHIGKENSKLIFLEGQNLKHIGTTLDIGTKNLHTYDVYFSKILLEMENGNIPRLDNVVLCGDDRSENLVLSFYGTFPEANVVELKFDAIDVSSLSEEDQQNISAFSIPIAAAHEYYAEEKKEEIDGINILPKYIQENQKFLQFGWHSYVMLVVLFITTFLLTYFVLSNYREMSQLDKEIARLEEMQKRNESIINQITPLSNRIANFDNTQAILDSATTGTGVWGDALERYSNFVERRRNFWFTHLETVSSNDILIRGYSVSRSSLTEFARENNASILRNVIYEPLRENNAFSYVIDLKLVNNNAK